MTDASSFSQVEFDYLIVGGGTAGLALASRLSENNNIVVGVIEAGVFHQNDSLVDTPEFGGEAVGNSSYDWNFVTAPEAALGGRIVAQPRGKMLGGSSGLNQMAWTRASRTELNSFKSFGGDYGWTWGGLLPHFRNTENVLLDQTNPFPGVPQVKQNNNTFEGHTGPASLNAIYPDVIPQYVESYNALGIETNASPNNGSTKGITNSLFSVDRGAGTRSYAATAYYCPSSSRSNFHVLIKAQATRVLFRGRALPFSSLVADGVEFTVGSHNFIAKASKEVILSAGAVQTPQLLELSGIGNPTVLTQAGIKPLLNLSAVGENLQEHLFSSVQFLLREGHQTFDELRNNATFAAEQAAEYATSHTGWLAATDSAAAFLPLTDFVTDAQFQSMLTAFDTVTSQSGLTPLQLQQYRIQRGWLLDNTIPQVETILLSKGLVAPEVGQSYITVLGGLLHPLSRGSIHINSSDPFAPPVIIGNYLSNPFDVMVMLETMKWIVTGLAKVPSMAAIVQNISFPTISFSNDTDTTNFILETISPGDHLSGTAAMAPFDLGGVVDGSLKVYNTTNLRVVDASIIPLLVGAHIQTFAYAIADKAATLILGDL